MPQPTTSIHLPQPCAESWTAMTPTSTGRHCAACQKTVVDFTHKTDAEILAYFKQAGAAVPCGHFRASQLARPLQPALPPTSPAARWRGWLAAALAVWSLRAEAAGAPPVALAPPSAQQPRRQPAPVLPTRQVAGRVVRGVVRAADGRAPLAQAKVRLSGTHRTATTDANGYFRLWVPARRGPHAQQVLVVQARNFVTQAVRVPLAARAAQALKINLAFEGGQVRPDLERSTLSGAPMMLMQEVVETSPPPQDRVGRAVPLAAPAQSAPLTFYQRLTQPLRRKASAR